MIALSNGRVIELVAVGCWIVWYLVMVGVNLHRGVIEFAQSVRTVVLSLLVVFITAIDAWRAMFGS